MLAVPDLLTVPGVELTEAEALRVAELIVEVCCKLGAWLAVVDWLSADRLELRLTVPDQLAVFGVELTETVAVCVPLMEPMLPVEAGGLVVERLEVADGLE